MEGESNCKIYRVHRQLRELNPEAYEPKMLAIGPYHHGKNDLEMMEYHKRCYFDLLCSRINKETENFWYIIAPLASRARSSYAERIELDEFHFTRMLVIDGCFIIEFVLRDYMGEFGQHDPLLDLPWIRSTLKRDLMLFENQIPFFVLYELCDLITNVPNQQRELANLLLLFFEDMNPLARKVESRSICPLDIKHLLDMMHRNWCPDEARMQSVSEEGRVQPGMNQDIFESSSEKQRVLFIESARRLEEANVKFERKKRGNLFELDFKNGTIFMPPLAIHDGTESLLSNLIAYELYFYDQSNMSSGNMLDYVHLLDCLIDSSKDIEILCRNGIIENSLGDKEVIVKMINKLGVSIGTPPHRFIYTEIFDMVNAHCKTRRNTWMAKLRRNYLNMAIALLLLTVIQTVFTALQGVYQFHK